MQNHTLICPSCSGAMKLAEAKPGDKIAKCEYCNTVVDLPDTAEKQGFNLNDFFNGFNLDGFTNTGNVTHTTTNTHTSTTVFVNGKPVQGDGVMDLESVKDILKKSGVSIKGLTDKED
jgi:hypothetical protein